LSSSRLCGHRVSRVYHHQPVASPCDLFQSAKLWLEEPDQAVVSRVFLEGGACLSGNLCGTSCAGWVIFPDSHPVGGASVARSSSPPRVPSRGRGPVIPCATIVAATSSRQACGPKDSRSSRGHREPSWKVVGPAVQGCGPPLPRLPRAPAVPTKPWSGCALP